VDYSITKNLINLQIPYIQIQTIARIPIRNIRLLNYHPHSRSSPFTSNSKFSSIKVASVSLSYMASKVFFTSSLDLTSSYQ
jgi:hypothetical protein